MDQDQYKPYHTEQNEIYDGSAYAPMSEKLIRMHEMFGQEVIAKSFLYMVAALGVTAVAAFVAPGIMAEWLMRGRFNIFILFIAEIAIVIASNVAVKKNNVPLMAVLFTVYSYLTGSTLGIIFWMYDLTSVGAVFLMTALMFGIMAVYGLITKRDLSSIGNLCIMGLIGIIIAGLANAFIIKNGIFDFIISAVGILIFVGLTAYDVQKIKERVEFASDDNVQILALSGAFELYLDFINLFLRLLSLFGKKK